MASNDSLRACAYRTPSSPAMPDTSTVFTVFATLAVLWAIRKVAGHFRIVRSIGYVPAL